MKLSSAHAWVAGMVLVASVAAMILVENASAASPALTGGKGATLSFVRDGSVFVDSPDLRTATVYLAAHHDGGESYTYSLPAWSPDGTALAATELDSPPPSSGLFPSAGLVVVRTGAPVFSPDCDSGDHASWSPDGDTIVFLCVEFYYPSVVGEVHVLNLVTGSDAYLHSRPEPHTPVDAAPAWSPDGKLIAFARYAPDPSGAYTCADPSGSYTCSGHVSTIAATGGTVRVFAKASGTNPSWSPDGRYIAFDNGRRIGIIDRSGGAIRFIATGTQPAWSPDGDTIAYVDGGNVWLIDARGQHRRLAIRKATDPAWRPAP